MAMGDTAVKNNLNEFKQNCTNMENNTEILKSSTEQVQTARQTCAQIEQLRALSSNAKKILACHDSLDVQNKVNSYTAHCSQCKMSKKDIGCGIHSSDPECLKLKEVQSNWIELHKCIRFIYKNAISSIPCVTSNETVPEHVNESLKELIEKLYKEDHQQLFIRLEVLVRDFVLEAKNRLKDLQNNVDDIPVLYLRGLLTSYGAFCAAAENLALYIPQLDSLLLQRFSVNFELLNKYLFQTCLYADAYVQNNVPLYISQLRTTNSCSEFTNQELVHSYLALDDEMTDVASRWLDVKKLILKHSKKRDLTHYKQPLLFEDWEIYREYQELATNKIWRLRTIKRDLLEFDVQLLSLLDDITNHICELDLNTNKNRACNTCKNCNSDILCSCDDCTIKHILSCCMETPPASPVDNNTQDNTYSFNTNTQTQQINMTSKPCSNNNSDELESIRNKKCVLSSTYDISDALAQNALANAGLYSSSLFQSGRSPKGISKPGKDENNALFPCNNKVNKIPMSKNFLKLITDKIITNSFVKNFEENNKAVVTQAETTPSATVSTGTESSVTTASSTNATSKVPASSIASISFSQPTIPAPNSQGTNTPPVSVKPVQASKEPTQSTVNKPLCNQTYQDFNKKVKKEAVALQVCKDGCTEGDPVKAAKESKRCDCPHCEVFESTNPQFAGKNNKTRDRLRIRLNEKRNKTLKEKDTTENTTNKSSKAKESTEKVKVKCPDIQDILVTASVDTRDIRDLLNFIEGIDRNANLVNAQKKAAKKARRKEKKLEEERAKKAKLKEEADRIERERKLLEKQRQDELRLKGQIHESNKYKNSCKNKDDKSGKGNHSNNNHSKSKVGSYLPTPLVSDKKPNQAKSVGPMVTIKRVMECINSEPTVTITLKGSTPDKDKLLYTLVNGQTDIVSKTVDDIASIKTDLSKKQRKKKGKCEVPPEPVVVPLNKKERNTKKKQAKAKTTKPNSPTCTTKPEAVVEQSVKKETVPETSKTATQKPGATLNLQTLRLPPGITITKVDGPAVNRKLSFSTTNTPAETANTLPATSPVDNRSGVIVVDTVKLKQVLPSFVPTATAPAPVTKLTSVTTTKKKKGKKNKNKTDNLVTSDTCCLQSSTPFSYKISSNTGQSVPSDKGSSIVTIKNPMFYQLQDSLNKPKPGGEPPKWPKTQQASIIKGKNGMVTIRSPRLGGTTNVQSYNGHVEQHAGPMHKISATSLSELKPVMGPHTPIFKPAMNIDNKKPFNAQEILSGLPGIEITKISKNSTRNKSECKMFQPADVSIIPTNIANGSNGDVYKLFYDNMDWSLESVFAPKDIKEDEVLDAEELELEAFKRFCQQSVPPERKEKVAHLNVKDIVLKKKTSTNVC